MLNPQATAYEPMSQISVGTARVIYSGPSQPVGFTSNIPSQSTKMQHKGGLNTYDSSTHQHQDSRYFVQKSRGNVATQALFEILKRQEELTAYLVHQAQTHTPPNREIPVFDGNPLHYVPFIQVFEHGVDE